ncbi:MAG: pyrroloquinoline quinone-dependent dehydrogenase [Gemmatimonadaceae bacterium]
MKSRYWVCALVGIGCRTVGAPPTAIDWPVYGGDPEGSRYSAATDIARANVARLKVAWTYSTGPTSIEATTRPKEGKPPNFETTPIVIDGTLYFSTPLGRVIALDATTGAELWTYDGKVDISGNYGDNANRGVATWLDKSAPANAVCRRRILLATIDARLIALDAASGKPCRDFGDNGVVELSTNLRNGVQYKGEYEETSPPTVVNDIIVVGSAIADNNRIDGPSGVVRGFDSRTGRLRWSWDPVPQDSTDPGWRTWIGPKAHRTGAANAWSIMAADPERDLVFVPTGSPSVDYFGGERLGDNLYANSVVALRASTGERVWHFQLVHHDLWDYDVAASPLLATLPVHGRDVPVVMQTGKSGQLFVLDRVSGVPVLPVEERPAPKSDVPGEIAATTQPYSSALPNLTPNTLSSRDAFGINSAEREECRARMQKFRNGAPFTPPSVEGTVYRPSNVGGAQWGGMAYDPVRHIAVVPMNHSAVVVQLLPRTSVDSTKLEEGWEYATMDGTPWIMRRQSLTGKSGVACTPPPLSALVAVDLVTRRKIWETPLGDMQRTLTIVGDSTKVDARLGTTTYGGPIITATGLVFISGTSDQRIHAFDIESGREIWYADLPGRGKATPMTYRAGKNQKQYVVIAVGGGSLGGRGATIVAFSIQ